MMKLICLFAVLSVIAVGSVESREVPSSSRIARAAEPSALESEKDTSNQKAVAANDDLDNAETFGFGFNKHVHVYGGYGGPAYYPYPRYYPHPGYYGYGYGYGQPYYYY